MLVSKQQLTEQNGSGKKGSFIFDPELGLYLSFLYFIFFFLSENMEIFYCSGTVLSGYSTLFGKSGKLMPNANGLHRLIGGVTMGGIPQFL